MLKGLTDYSGIYYCFFFSSNIGQACDQITSKKFGCPDEPSELATFLHH